MKKIEQDKNIYDLSSLPKLFRRKRLINSEKTTIRTKSLYDASSNPILKKPKKAAINFNIFKSRKGGVSDAEQCKKAIKYQIIV